MEPHRPVIGADVAAGADGGLTAGYDLGAFFDEMFERPASRGRTTALLARAARGDERRPARASGSGSRTPSSSRRGSASRSTATTQGTERIFPFDLVPRIVPADEWEPIERGLEQRDPRAQPLPRRHLPRAADPRGRDRAGRARLRLAELPARDDGRSTCPGGIYAHVGGTDLVRDGDGRYLVLEDNLPHPVGRQLHAREPPGAEARLPGALRRATACGRSSSTRASCSRRCARSPRARRERAERRPAHARRLQLGVLRALVPRRGRWAIELVEGRDLVVDRNRVYMRTTRGLAAGRRHLPPRSTTTSSTRSRSGGLACSASPG